MNSLIEKTIHTVFGDKTIAVHVMNILDLTEKLDVMTVSAFYNSYGPVDGTLMKALYDKGIYVNKLSDNPEIDLRKTIHVWLSEEVKDAQLPIKRIGCIEMSNVIPRKNESKEKETISSIRAYFRMLEIASLSCIDIKTLGLPILGGGMQEISQDLIMIPVLNECMRFLETNEQIEEIHIITTNQKLAFQFATALTQSYSFKQNSSYAQICNEMNKDKCVYISYSSIDKNIADNLCYKLESNGIKVWYAPRDIQSGDFATAIVDAISKCSHFSVILSKNSLQSQHVLNEINLAFNQLNRNIQFKPLKIDEEELGAAFTYYLSRQHWMDAHVPPLEDRLDEFVQQLLNE